MESDAISVRQPVYRPKLLRDLQKTKKEILLRRLLLSYKEDKLKMKVAETYLRSLRAYEEELLIEKRISLLTEQKNAASKSIEAGTGTITELAEINAANDKASADQIRANQEYQTTIKRTSIFYRGEFLRK